MAKDAAAIRIGRKVGEHHLAQFVEYVVVHPVAARPGLLRGIQVEARAGTEFPIVRLAGDAGVARTGIAGHHHQSQLCRDPLGPGLDDERLLSAGQACQIEKHGYPARRMRRLVHGEAHRQADGARVAAVEALRAPEAAILA